MNTNWLRALKNTAHEKPRRIRRKKLARLKKKPNQFTRTCSYGLPVE